MLLLVASLYYIEGLGQAKVAKLAGLSQANVSRLLQEARRKGIVQIQVKPFSPRDQVLEKKLTDKFHFRHCIVIKTIPGQTSEQYRYTMGHFAAPVLSQLIKSGSVVCVAAGRHMNAVTEEMRPHQPTYNNIFIQATGDISTQIQENDAIELTRRLAKRWGGQYYRLQAPAITPDHRSYQIFVEHEQIKYVLNQMDRANLAIVGIGNPVNSVFYTNEFSEKYKLNILKSRGMVGEICGHFLDQDGNECETVYTHRIIGINLEQLKKIPEVVAVTGGKDRAPAVRAAAKAGIINSLVIDDYSAAELLRLD